ncbi:MAG: DUF3343 domain-containing protein [Oscillospiraceae bacterium]|nr:DUF3343 domain-containing protein [Oscillospiraceae bacterium]
MSAIILFRSLTHAQRGTRVLSAGGVPAKIIKAPAGLSDKGCVYAAGVTEKRLRQALEVLDSRQISHGRVFVPDGSGGYREVWA